MNRKHFLTRLAKLLVGALQHTPHAYGLVPDQDGYVRLKELLQALHELDAYRRIRRSDIEELLITHPNPGVEISGNRIRAVGAPFQAPPSEAKALPKILYTCIRRKAHGAALKNGIRRSADAPPIVLTPEVKVAERLGRRRDNAPLLVTIQVAKAVSAGAVIRSAGEGLFVTDRLPLAGLQLPPLPRDRSPLEKAAESSPQDTYRPAGSYQIDLAAESPAKTRRSREAKKGKDPEWKRHQKRSRRR